MLYLKIHTLWQNMWHETQKHVPNRLWNTVPMEYELQLRYCITYLRGKYLTLDRYIPWLVGFIKLISTCFSSFRRILQQNLNYLNWVEYIHATQSGKLSRFLINHGNSMQIRFLFIGAILGRGRWNRKIGKIIHGHLWIKFILIYMYIMTIVIHVDIRISCR